MKDWFHNPDQFWQPGPNLATKIGPGPDQFSLDRTVFPRELGPGVGGGGGGGGHYSLWEYGPPDRKLGRTPYGYDTGIL